MASNDYLDIANHPSVKSAVMETAEVYGFGFGGSRLTTGNTVIHDALERKIASYKETEAAIVFNTGYVANLATISSIMKKGDTIFSDELNHASIIDGCRLSKAKIVTYAHNDMDDLRRKALEVSSYLYENGYLISAIRFPTVAKGSARLQVALMSSHTEEELSRCVELIGKAFVLNGIQKV